MLAGTIGRKARISGHTMNMRICRKTMGWGVSIRRARHCPRGMVGVHRSHRGGQVGVVVHLCRNCCDVVSMRPMNNLLLKSGVRRNVLVYGSWMTMPMRWRWHPMGGLIYHDVRVLPIWTKHKLRSRVCFVLRVQLVRISSSRIGYHRACAIGFGRRV